MTPGDFRYGESERVPPQALFAIGAVDGAALALAWAYVASRGMHSLIHLTYKQQVLSGSAWSLP